MKYVAIWFATFAVISAADALWHLGIFGWAYGPGFKSVARMQDGRLALQPIPGIISQVLVVSALTVLTVLSVRAGQGYPRDEGRSAWVSGSMSVPRTSSPMAH